MMLKFFTTSGCHLCEQAAEIIHRVIPDFEDLLVESVDIADDDNLMELYGVRIPVVKLDTSDADLGWPFDEAALRTFLEQAQ